MKWISETVGAALDLILPPHCVGCGLAVASGYWCQKCREEIRWIGPPRCDICSHPFDGTFEGAFVCPNCSGRNFHFECAVAVARSQGPVRELIHRLKYHGAEWTVQPLAELGLLGLQDPRLQSPAPDALVPVPLHSLRRRDRGYNQAELLARAIGCRAGIPVLDPLRRCRPTATQTHFDRRKRMQNLRGAFEMRQNTDVRDMKLILVDDVLTTGSTLNACARVLCEFGAGSTRALAIARG